MKSRSILFLLTGIAVGAVTAILFTSQKGVKSRKALRKKTKKYKKAFKETASKYKEKLADLKEDVQDAKQDAKKKST